MLHLPWSKHSRTSMKPTTSMPKSSFFFRQSQRANIYVFREKQPPETAETLHHQAISSQWLAPIIIALCYGFPRLLLGLSDSGLCQLPTHKISSKLSYIVVQRRKSLYKQALTWKNNSRSSTTCSCRFRISCKKLGAIKTTSCKKKIEIEKNKTFQEGYN